jgi:hypothetical protein
LPPVETLEPVAPAIVTAPPLLLLAAVPPVTVTVPPEAAPTIFPVIVPARKFPDPSLEIIVEAVLRFVAVVFALGRTPVTALDWFKLTAPTTIAVPVEFA